MAKASEAWEDQLRLAFTQALASTMEFLRGNFEDVVRERDELRERNKYLEQRVKELETRRAA